MKKQIQCQCGCGHSGSRSVMRTVRLHLSTKTDGQSRFSKGQSWQVLPQCEKPFVREMQMTTDAKALAVKIQGANIFTRAKVAGTVYQLIVSSRERRIGKEKAEAEAKALYWDLVLPRWAKRLFRATSKGKELA